MSHLAALIQQTMDRTGQRLADIERDGGMTRGRLSWFMHNRLTKPASPKVRRQLSRGLRCDQRTVDRAIGLDVGMEVGELPFIDPLEGLDPDARRLVVELADKLRNGGRKRRSA